MFDVKKITVLAVIVCIVIVLGVVFFGMTYFPEKENEAEQFYATNQLNLTYSYVLIVSEESSFKNSLVKTISDHFYSKPILFSIIDEASLTSTNEDLWDKVIIVTAAHNDDVVQEINSFINTYKDPEKVCLVITTDSGKWSGNSRDGVDVITTTSKLKNTDRISGEIIKLIDSVALQ
jgi:type II secretory pathway pseudopilin PulG